MVNECEHCKKIQEARDADCPHCGGRGPRSTTPWNGPICNFCGRGYMPKNDGYWEVSGLHPKGEPTLPLSKAWRASELPNLSRS